MPKGLGGIQMAEPHKISCSFSLFDDGCQYTGNHRKYLVANAREICYSAPTRERLALREAYSYYGHGRRILAGRMKIGEVEAVTLPDGGTAIISNIPSNITIAFDVAEDGTVTHTQELLSTETGQIVKGLHESRVGGFSWACPGTDRGSKGITHLSGFAGFDYVLSPGFSTNRGYVLESADAAAEQGILESVAATLHDDSKANNMCAAGHGIIRAESPSLNSSFSTWNPTGPRWPQSMMLSKVSRKKQRLREKRPPKTPQP